MRYFTPISPLPDSPAGAGAGAGAAGRRSTPLLADDNLNSFAREQGCVPLAQRDIGMPNKEKAEIALIAMAPAVGGAAFVIPAAISFAACVLAFMALKVVPIRNIYEALDGLVIVLLGTLIAVVNVIETTGAADLVALA